MTDFAEILSDERSTSVAASRERFELMKQKELGAGASDARAAHPMRELDRRRFELMEAVGREITDNYLRHAVIATSQYDDTCASMAAEILRLRAAVAPQGDAQPTTPELQRTFREGWLACEHMGGTLSAEECWADANTNPERDRTND